MSHMDAGMEAYLKGAKFMPQFFHLDGVRALTKECQDRQEKLENDQNNYEIEMENYNEQTEDVMETIKAEIERLKAEIAALEEKAENGTITEEEKVELEAKQGKLTNLQEYLDAESAKRQQKASEMGEEFLDELFESKEIGDTTIKMGEPLAKTEVKRENWFRRLFGITRRQQERKEVGEAAVEAGTNLLGTIMNIFVKALTGLFQALNNKPESEQEVVVSTAEPEVAGEKEPVVPEEPDTAVEDDKKPEEQ